MFEFHEKDFIPQLSIDCVIFGFFDKKLNVLLPKLRIVKNLWTLPGGFILQQENIDQAATRILEDRIGLKDIYLKQFNVFGSVDRTTYQSIDEISNSLKMNPKTHQWLRQRFITIGYFALVDFRKVVPKVSAYDESCQWYDVKQLPHLAFDHAGIIESAVETLRIMLDNNVLGFRLLSETFTMKEVQELYEAILDKPLRRNNFHKKILELSVLERLDKKYTGAANKAPYLYRVKNKYLAA
jgi:8-oxo-dGTP diphosphatase